MPVVSILPAAGSTAQVPASTNPADTLLELENRSDTDMFYGLGGQVSTSDPAFAGIRLPANGGYRCISGPGARLAVFIAHASGSAKDLVYRRAAPPV